MPRRPVRTKFLALLTSMTLLASSSGFAAADATPAAPVDAPAADTSLESEIESLKAENALVRELLRKMEEQQEALLEQVDRLQRRFDGVPTADAQPAGQPVAQVPEPTAQAAPPPPPA